MIAPAASGDDVLSTDAARRLDAACNAFETAWAGGGRPRIEAFLAGFDEPERSAVLCELVQLDAYHRRRAGEACGPDDYRDRFPDLDPQWLAGVFAADAARGSTIDAPARDPAANTLTGSPTRFGDYELLAEIARGGMGVVYRARQVSLNRPVAVKMILSGQFASPAEVQRFRSEAEAAAALDHPNIVPIYEVGERDGRHYFAMKLVDGPSLAGFVARAPGLAPAEAARLVAAVARAVHHAHQHGILHRDLKPANILLELSRANGQGPAEAPDPGGGFTPLVSDFGLAKRVEGPDGATASGAVVGTPGYMAPEQADGRANRLTTAADVWSLGAVLYELLTGRPPFKAGSVAETLMKVRFEEPPALRHLRPGVPRDLETVCLKCLRKAPEERYPGALTLAEDLERWLAHEPIRARPAGTLERAVKWARRHPATAALVGVSGLAVAVVVAALAVSNVWVTAALGTAQERERDAKNALAAETEALRKLQAQEKATQAALADRNKALDERTKALEELTKANAATKTALGREQRVANYRGIALAAQQWQDHQTAQADQTLEECRPPELRAWEWHYLKRLCYDNGLLTLRGDIGRGNARPFTPDGKRLAMIGPDRKARLVDVGTGKEVLALPGFRGGLKGLTVSPDGRLLAAGSYYYAADRKAQSEVKVWDLADGREVLTLAQPRFRGSVVGVAISSDGRRLATATVRRKATPTGGTSDDGGDIQVWDAATGEERLALAAHDKKVRAVAFSPDDTRLAAAVGSNAVKVWDAATGREQFSGIGSGEFESVAFSPDGLRLAAAGPSSGVRVWDLKTGQEVRTLVGHTGPVHSVAFSPDGKRLASASGDRTVRVWDVAGSRELLTLRGRTDAFCAAAFTPDGRRLVSATFRPGEVRTTPSGLALYMEPLSLPPGAVQVWDAVGGQEAAAMEGHTSSAWGVAFSVDGKRLASAGQDKTVKVYDVATRETVRTLAGHADWVLGVAFAPDGRSLASAGRDKTVRVWDLATGQARTFKGHTSAAHAVAFSPDGKSLASTGADNAVRVWDVATGDEVRAITGHTDWTTGVAFSPDGKYLASAGCDRFVRVWDTATGREAFPPQEHSGRVYAVAFSGDGSALASACTDGPRECGMSARNVGGRMIFSDPSGDGTVRVWELATGREVFARRGPASVAYGVAFSPDGRRLASTTGQHVAVWDPATGQEVLTLRGHRSITYGVAFSREGLLASTDAGGGVRVWNAAPFDPAYFRRLADELAAEGNLRRFSSEFVEAEAAYRKALVLRDRLAADAPADHALRHDVAKTHLGLAQALKAHGLRAEAEAEYKTALAIQQALADEFPQVADYRHDLGVIHNDMGILYFDSGRGRAADAEAVYRLALVIREKLAADAPANIGYATELGGTCCNLGHVFAHGKNQAEVGLEWYRRAIQTLEPLVPKDRSQMARRFLFNSYEGRAQALELLKRYAEAVADYDRAVEVGGGSESLRQRRALALVRTGEYGRAVAEATALAEVVTQGGSLYDLACVCSLASDAVANDPLLAEQYAARAIEILTKARKQRYFDAAKVAHMKKDADIDPLRGRADYHLLLTELERDLPKGK